MPFFRSSLEQLPRPLTPSTIDELLEEILRPAHFFVACGSRLEWEHLPPAETSWEVFRGRLLEPAHTRLTQSFECWNVYLTDETGRSGEPLLSLKLDRTQGVLHVVRAILCHVWEGYAEGNVYRSRETTRWVRELTGTIPLAHFEDSRTLRDELVCRVFHAVVGASRLPLTSVEAPLPGFSLGRLAYFHRPLAGREAPPMTSWHELIEGTRDAGLNLLEQTKLLETLLHVTPKTDLAALAQALCEGGIPEISGGAGTLKLLRSVFNETSLSPYTDLVDKALSLVDALESSQQTTPAEAVDFLGGLIRQLAWHLTAYDLVTFHHRGANYPDALLLDTALKSLLVRVERTPVLFEDEDTDPERVRECKRIRRRALRMGWLLRRFHEGQPVPDAPTSPGERVRVLPPPHVLVPEEQILQPAKRESRLFAGDPLTDHLDMRGESILRQSISDLQHPEELLDLGTALFLDRPLGGGKTPGEPDATVLLSHRAFSRRIARQRLEYLAGPLRLILIENRDDLLATLTSLPVAGVPVSVVGGRPRPGAVSATDARQVSDDFLFLRTTTGSAREFFRQYDFSSVLSRFRLASMPETMPVLILPVEADRLAIFDTIGQRRLELMPDVGQGHVSRAGREYLRSGLRVLRVWEETDRAGELREQPLDQPIILTPMLD
jgi:hypothetical protein